MSQVLSQEEVDALLRGVSDGDIETDSEEIEDEAGVVSYDLTSQERIIRGRMPTLDIINQRFSRTFRTTLSSALRKIIDISVVSTDTVKFGEFIKSLPVPTSLHIFKMEPLRGYGLLVAESKLVFALVDTFFGGSGSSSMKIEGRDFTTIEQKIIKKFVVQALADLEEAWAPVQEIKTSHVRTEVNPQFAAVVPPADVIIVILFEVEMEEVSGTITICLPYSTIEPIINKLKAGFQSEQLEVDYTWVKRLRNQIKDATVNMVVELGTATITSRDLLDLKCGDVIKLDNYASEEITVKVEGIPKYTGTPGVYRGNRALRVKTVLKRKGGD